MVDLHDIDDYFFNKNFSKIQNLLSIEKLRVLTQKKEMLLYLAQCLSQFEQGFNLSKSHLKMTGVFYSIFLTDGRGLPTIVEKDM